MTKEGFKAEPVARLGPSGFDPGEFERRVNFCPAFDKRHPEPSKNYGIGSMRIRFVLIGPLGGVQWMIGTPWYVASARSPALANDRSLRPEGWVLGYHSPKPLYDSQTPMDSCDVLPVGPCYYDGSGLNADILIENFLAHGDDYVWKALEAYYRTTFEGAPWPFDDDGNIARIEAGTDETPKEVRPEGRKPDKLQRTAP